VDPEGTLWFSNVTREDKSSEFLYSCAAYSPFRNEYKLGNRVYLSVAPTSSSASQNKKPPLMQYATKRNTVAIRGNSVTLWCIVGGT
jgi:neuronal cell adhesion protein